MGIVGKKDNTGKFKTYLIKPFLSLNKNPILFKGRNFHLVYFGLFMAFSIFISNTLLLFYLNSKGIQFTHHPIVPLGIMLFSMFFFTKFFHIFVVGLDYFRKPLYYLNQTAMYNQGGLVGTGIGAILVLSLENLNPIIYLDALAFCSTLALFVGRLACYNYGCCSGQPTESKFHVKYSNPNSKILRIHPELKDVPLHPTQLVAALFNLFLFIAAILFSRFFSIDGVIFVSFLISYNLFRYITQQKRVTAGIRIISRTALLFLFVGLCILVVSIIFREQFYTQTPFIKLLTLKNFFSDILLNGEYMLTSGISAILAFIFYGLHGRKLGQYFGG
ncbi:prolipoprotein diacylglyceryl transferase family protein [Candidatus Lokiarchaeum ossiferum]|uniref:prolipoprotein diacylglyceryl transferase family protein n=1 Tax=Candidatus Lokiarchaeum ossiferum TaxID=2951803 RepID=UPI00352F91E1